MKGSEISFLPTPMTKTLPPNLTAQMAAAMSALDAGALERERGLDTTEDLHDLLCRLLGGEALDLVCDGLGADLLGELETALVDIGDDQRAGTGGPGAEKGDETDGSGTADEDRVAELELGTVQAREGDGQGLQHRAVLVRHVTDLVAPDGRVVDVAPQQAGHRRRGEESQPCRNRCTDRSGKARRHCR